MTPTPVSGAALPNAAAPETPTRPVTVDDWFDHLYELYLRRFHPAVAAVYAGSEAHRRCRPVQR